MRRIDFGRQNPLGKIIVIRGYDRGIFVSRSEYACCPVLGTPSNMAKTLYAVAPKLASHPIGRLSPTLQTTELRQRKVAQLIKHSNDFFHVGAFSIARYFRNELMEILEALRHQMIEKTHHEWSLPLTDAP